MSTILPPRLPAFGHTEYWPGEPTTDEVLRRLDWRFPQAYDSLPTLGPAALQEQPTKLIQFRVTDHNDERYIPGDQRWVHQGHPGHRFKEVEVRTVDVAYGDWVKVTKVSGEVSKVVDKTDLEKALEDLDQAIRRQRLLEQLNFEKDSEVKAVRRQADVEIAKLNQQLANAEAETRRADSMSAQLSDALRDRDRARTAAESWKQLAENHRKRLDNVQEAMNGPTP